MDSPKKIGGKCIIVVGGTGSGKTTIVKKLLSNVNQQAIFLYDVNAEHLEFTNGSPLINFKDFAQQATKQRQSVLVFEEATIFLNNRGSDDNLTNILVRKRHTENTIILVFHSLRKIPKYIFDFCDYLILLKTNDPIEKAEQFDDPDIVEAFKRIRDAEPLLSDSGKSYSPHEILKLTH